MPVTFEEALQRIRDREQQVQKQAAPPPKSAEDEVNEEVTRRTNAYHESGMHVPYAVVLSEVMNNNPDLAARYRNDVTTYTSTGKPIGTTRASFGTDQQGRNVTKSAVSAEEVTRVVIGRATGIIAKSAVPITLDAAIAEVFKDDPRLHAMWHDSTFV